MTGLQSLRLTPDDSPREIVVDLLAGKAPALVFLHGMTSTREGTMSKRLLHRARTLGLGFARFDFRGHGDSDGDLSDMALSDLIADTEAVIGEVGSCVLVGSSLGGLVAAFTAGRNTDVVGLVLMSPAFGYLRRMAKQTESFELERSDESKVALGARAVQDAARFDENALPSSLHMPVFMVHGTDDRTIPIGVSETFCAAISHQRKELWLIEGGSHSLSEEIDDTLDRMEGFLREHQLIEG